MAQWPGRIAARASPPSPTHAEGASTGSGRSWAVTGLTALQPAIGQS